MRNGLRLFLIWLGVYLQQLALSQKNDGTMDLPVSLLSSDQSDMERCDVQLLKV
jgi:hypothetical protein